jgi:ABC-type antimicrobial peptide transport system permease subunit
VTAFQTWTSGIPTLELCLALGVFLLVHLILGCGLTHLAGLNKNKYNDIIVKKIKP